MLQGVYKQSHFELEEFVDMSSFDKIQVDIWKGIALTKSTVEQGYFPDLNSTLKNIYPKQYKSLMEAYEEYLLLPEENPIKIVGEEINNIAGHNALVTFLKYAFAAHDLHSHYPLWDQGTIAGRELSGIAKYFSTLIQWIDKLVEDNIFSNISRTFIIGIDCNGHAHEHRDPNSDPARSPEFIHIRPNLDRPFYIRDVDTNQKHYINSRVGWWNDGDLHGGEPTVGPSYALRIDGVFTDKFRARIMGKIL